MQNTKYYSKEAKYLFVFLFGVFFAAVLFWGNAKYRGHRKAKLAEACDSICSSQGRLESKLISESKITTHNVHEQHVVLYASVNDFPDAPYHVYIYDKTKVRNPLSLIETKSYMLSKLEKVGDGFWYVEYR
jgi:hypothetical protein